MCCPQATGEYNSTLESFDLPIPTTIGEATEVLHQMKVTEMEGLLAHIFLSTPPAHKLELRSKVQTQHAKFQKVPNASVLMHERFTTRMKNALIFK